MAKCYMKNCVNNNEWACAYREDCDYCSKDCKHYYKCIDCDYYMDESVEEEFKENNKLELLKAKDAIFKLIGQFHRASKFDDGKLYIYDYCESALELAFTVLGIEPDFIPLLDFCKMWEDNNRAIWEINFPDKPYNGTTADIYYDIFKKDLETWERLIDEEDDD